MSENTIRVDVLVIGAGPAGLAAAIEAMNDPIASVGYGIAYPFGVISVVLFVQAMPKLLHTNLEEEKA